MLLLTPPGMSRVDPASGFWASDLTSTETLNRDDPDREYLAIHLDLHRVRNISNTRHFGFWDNLRFTLALQERRRDGRIDDVVRTSSSLTIRFCSAASFLCSYRFEKIRRSDCDRLLITYDQFLDVRLIGPGAA